ncbi:MAG: hypothetical protein AAF560_10795 [Acidobacteriota bacterium]
MTETTSDSLFMRCGDSKRDIQNALRAAGAILAWAICFAGSSQLLKREMVPEGAMQLVVAAIPSLFGIFVLIAYGRLLRESDELQRLVQLQALAIAFGGTFLAVSTYAILERLGAPRADLADAITVMAVLYAVGSVIGWRRFS